MAKKFAEITGVHKIFKSETPIEGQNAGTTVYTEMYITDSELQENIDKNTIVFVTADNEDVDKIIGPNNYKISKNDCFIVAQNKVYAAFGKVNVSDVVGPTGEKGENGAGSVSDLMGLYDTQYTTDISTVSLIEGDYGISKEGNVWVYNGSSLINSGVNLKGPKGNTGEPGAQGPAGETSGGTTEIIKDSLPIGAITMYAGEQNPDGWLFCNGAEISIKSISNINIPGRGDGPDGEELFTTDFDGTEIKWQIADKGSEYLCDLLKIIKSNYGIETPRTNS